MNVTLNEDTLVKRAAEMLGPHSPLGLPGEPLFDNRLPLPHPPVAPDGFPSLGKLFGVVADPYAAKMRAAYVEMSNFAARWCPPIGNVIYAEPLFEWIMHADPFRPHYRDHIVHQVRVAAIGDILLDQRVGRQTLLELAADVLKRRLGTGITKNPPAFVRLAWWLAAIFHDCGYPYQHYCDSFRMIQKTYEISIGHPTSTSWFSCYRNLTDLAGALEVDDIDNSEQGKHAFTSAAELASEEQAYEDTAGKPEDREIRARRRMLFSLAVNAVRVHHGGPNPNAKAAPISFDTNPLGYLLVLSDEIHEIERPMATFERGKAGDLTEIRYTANPIKSVIITGNPARAGKSSPVRLSLNFRCATKPTRIAGKPVDDWSNEKQDEKLVKRLALGPGQPFAEIRVSVT
jgi:hypothetical protein